MPLQAHSFMVPIGPQLLLLLMIPACVLDYPNGIKCYCVSDGCGGPELPGARVHRQPVLLLLPRGRLPPQREGRPERRARPPGARAAARGAARRLPCPHLHLQ